MKLKKEECERYLVTLKQLIHESSQGCLKPDECIEIQTFRQLIDEYFDNPSLTLKELEQMTGEPVWNDCMNEWVLVKEVGKCILGDFVGVIAIDGEYMELKENKFYRKQVQG